MPGSAIAFDEIVDRVLALASIGPAPEGEGQRLTANRDDHLARHPKEADSSMRRMRALLAMLVLLVASIAAAGGIRTGPTTLPATSPTWSVCCGPSPRPAAARAP